MFIFSALPETFFGFQKGKRASIISSCSGSTLIPDKKCSCVSIIMWKGSSVYKRIEVSYIGYLYQLMLDSKQCDIKDLPYLNYQMSDSIDLEEDVQSPQNLLEAEHKLYFSMAKN